MWLALIEQPPPYHSTAHAQGFRLRVQSVGPRVDLSGMRFGVSSSGVDPFGLRLIQPSSSSFCLEVRV